MAMLVVDNRWFRFAPFQTWLLVRKTGPKHKPKHYWEWRLWEGWIPGIDVGKIRLKQWLGALGFWAWEIEKPWAVQLFFLFLVVSKRCFGSGSKPNKNWGWNRSVDSRSGGPYLTSCHGRHAITGVSEHHGFTRPGKHTKSYSFIVDLPIKNGDFP